VAPTPTLCLQALAIGARGGIAITASHNAAQWNALKFVGRNGRFLTKQRANELFDIYHQGDFAMVAEENLQAAETLRDPTRRHFDRILAYVDAATVRQRKLKVAVDGCNGVGAVYTRGFLEQLGCAVVACCDAPTGVFERDPEPLPENIGRLCELVRREGCDVGFAQDPDGDRLAIVDETGRPIGEDLTVAFAVRGVLTRHERGPVVIHLSTSRSVRRAAERLGSEVMLTPIGEINVSETMVAVGAVVGGEGNGGVIVPAIHPCRDSFAGMAIVLETMAVEGRTVSALCAEFPRYFMLKDKVRVRPEEVSPTLRMLRRQYADRRLTLLDGVHAETGEAWFHVRASNTEPVLRIIAETPDGAATAALVREVRGRIAEFIQSGAKDA
jgi:phosphomannomutase